MPFVNLKIPMKTVSESNRTSEHWTKKAKRHKKQQQVIRYILNTQEKPPYFPVKVTLTRIAPRSLDSHENLPMAFKWITDAISDWLIPGLAKGRADSDKRIQWEFEQQKGNVREYAILITISSINNIPSNEAS